MNILRKSLAFTGWTTLGASGAYVLWTRQSRIVDVPPSDYIFHSTLFARYNPNNAPVTQDLCVRKVPIRSVRAELLEKKDEGALVEAFCQGVWSGSGFALQRRILERNNRNEETKSDLWDQAALTQAKYEVGQIVTDHFEVVSKNPSSIIVRCGDSPRVKDVRASDGLFEMTAEVKEGEGIVEFGLKSVFYNGLAQADKQGKPPMGTVIQWLHQQYDKVLMETAITNCTR